MPSNKLYYFARLLFPVFTPFFFCLTALGLDEKPKFLLVTDFGHYKKFNYNDVQILTSYSNSGTTLVFTHENNSMLYIKKGLSEVQEFKASKKEKNYQISTANGEISFSKMEKIIRNWESTSKLCETGKGFESIKVLNTPEMSNKIRSLNISETIIKSTCNEEQRELLEESIDNTFNNTKNKLITCPNTQGFQKRLKVDTNFQKYMSNVYSRFFSLVEAINVDPKKTIGFSCQIPDARASDKIGQFHENASPERISINMDLISRNHKPDDQQTIIAATLNHELFHFGYQTVSDNLTFANCIDESYANIFSCTCGDLTENLNEEQFSQALVEKNCKSSPTKSLECDPLTGINSFKNRSSKGEMGTALAKSLEHSNIQKAEMHVQTQFIQKTVTKEDFLVVSEPQVKALTSQVLPGGRLGRPTPVPSGSPMAKAFMEIYNAANSKSKILTQKLNSALATVTPAQATAPPKLTANSTSATTGAKATAGALSSIPTPSSKRTIASQNAETAAESIPAGATSATIANAKIVRSAGTSEMGGASVTNARNTPSSPETASNLPARAPASIPSGSATSGASSRTINSNLSSVAGAISGAGAPTSPAVKSIQSLKSFTTVSGSQYREIRSQYNNSDFKNLLETYGMRISVKGRDGRITNLGTRDANNTNRVFVDDGTKLKFVEKKQ